MLPALEMNAVKRVKKDEFTCIHSIEGLGAVQGDDGKAVGKHGAPHPVFHCACHFDPTRTQPKIQCQKLHLEQTHRNASTMPADGNAGRITAKLGSTPNSTQHLETVKEASQSSNPGTMICTSSATPNYNTPQHKNVNINLKFCPSRSPRVQHQAHLRRI